MDLPWQGCSQKNPKKSEIDYSTEEQLYTTLHGIKEYKIVCSLCNHAKHFECDRDKVNRQMDILHGARAGLMQAGDSLSITHFTVDGIEVRTIFAPVYTVYFEYFKHLSN